LKSLLHFVIGGSRSGKSLHAESVAAASGLPVSYLATYCTEEATKCAPGSNCPARCPVTGNIVTGTSAELENEVSLLRIAPLWFVQQVQAARGGILRVEQATQTAVQHERALIVVSNEVGTGLVPSTSEGRNFRDLCGSANQLVAGYATTVEYLVAGLPLVLKGGC
jgi:adenosylcobinamide kinase/adenosylcobinamide-phosphate guanylyltransferase